MEYGEMSVAKAPTPADRVWAQTFLAWAWCRAGEPQRGVEVLAALLPLYRMTNFVPGELWVTLYLGEGYLLAGDADQATRTLHQCLELGERCRMMVFIGCAHRFLGEIAAKSDEAESRIRLATSHLDQSITIFSGINAENELALSYASYGRLCTRQNWIPEARDYLARALAIFERLGTLREPEKVRKDLASLPAA